ncbi:hypothetical protein GCM10027578_42290 [Spirosoma luteolum]
MKTNHSPFVAALLVSISIAGSLSACAQATSGVAMSGGARTSAPAQQDPNKTALVLPMRQMTDRLSKLQATGDPDFDYAFQAKIHAQGEQELLKKELQMGKDSTLKNMAQSLMPALESDIALIDGAMRQVKPTRPNQAFTQQQDRNVKAMALKFQAGGTTESKMTGNIDDNFAAVLLEHRQDAIDLAKTYLQYGKNDALKAYAQSLITKAGQEMSQLKKSIK